MSGSVLDKADSVGNNSNKSAALLLSFHPGTTRVTRVSLLPNWKLQHPSTFCILFGASTRP